MFSRPYAKRRKQWSGFEELCGKFSEDIPLFFLPGNHDIMEVTQTGIDAYMDRYGYDRFCFSHGNTLFIGIDTQVMRYVDAEWEHEQLDWLRSRLDGSCRYDHRILFGHHPLFTVSADEPDDYDNIPLSVPSRYLEVLRDADVRVMFCGHLHRNHTVADDNITINIYFGARPSDRRGSFRSADSKKFIQKGSNLNTLPSKTFRKKFLFDPLR